MNRLFVAVTPDDEARHGLAAQLDGAIPPPVPGQVVRPENWHLTLRFIGDVDDPSVDRILHALDDSPLGGRFRIRLGGLGAFPNAKRAQVLWVGVRSGHDEVGRLASTVDHALDAAGIDPEDRPFRPHLTISRFRPSESVRALIDGAGTIDVPMTIDRVILYESRLRRGGAAYRVVEEFPLRDR